MTAHADEFLVAWHRAVAERDPEALGALLSPDISMGAPPYWKRLEGKMIVQALLGVIVDTIDDFAYQRELIDGSNLALEFTGRVGELELQGIDLITLDDNGRLTQLDVMIRPINAMLALRDSVAPKIAVALQM